MESLYLQIRRCARLIISISLLNSWMYKQMKHAYLSIKSGNYKAGMNAFNHSQFENNVKFLLTNYKDVPEFKSILQPSKAPGKLTFFQVRDIFKKGEEDISKNAKAILEYFKEALDFFEYAERSLGKKQLQPQS